MIIPLTAHVVAKGTMLEIWANKECHKVKLPVPAYFYSKIQRNNLPAEESQEIVKYISDFKERVVHKYTFDSIKDIPLYRDENSMEADIPYVQRVAIDEPDYFLQYPQSNKLDVLHFDIEVSSTGKFPLPETNKIIGIGYALNDEMPTILTIKSKEDGDSEILEAFSDAIEALNPDILCGYFSNYFDLPYLIERMNIAGFSTRAFTRDEKAEECYFKNDEGNKVLYIKGRALFDIYDEVSIDQTLSGIQDRKMKTLAKWYNLQNAIRQRKGFEDYEVITEDLSNTEQLIGTQKLYDYLMSDVLITQELSKIYLTNIMTLCDLIQVPFNVIAKRSASMLATIFYARELKLLGVISDAANYQLHPKVFGKPAIIKKRGRMMTEFVGGTGYQGALVSINALHQKKLIKPLRKIDFAGMYPSIMSIFNLSPETVRLIALNDFVEGTFRINYKDDLEYELEFSDNRLQKNVVIRVLREEGFVPRNMKAFKNERAKIKREQKTCVDPDKKIELNSKSWVYKVLANATGYGANGTGFFRYGNLWAAVATTGIGRHLITLVGKELCGKDAESDTDGIFHFNFDVDAETIAKKVNDRLQIELGSPVSFEIEQDEYVAGIFFRMKNYALLDEKGRLIKHGVSMKASSKNLLLQTALNRILLAMLKEEDVEKVAFECYDKIDTAELYEFLMSSKIGMELEAYANQGSLQVTIGRQSKMFHDAEPRVGDQLSYAKTYGGYKIREIVKGTERIDKGYYRKQILKTIERLNLSDIKWKLENRGQKLLFEFPHISN